MKCPKCGDLSFEDVDRCRNCGFEFSLARPTDLALVGELPIRSRADSPGPLDDLALVDAARSTASNESGGNIDLVRSTPAVGRHSARVPSPSELPLFGQIDETPLVGRPSTSRPPLVVRRGALDVVRVRVEQSRGKSLDFTFDNHDSSEEDGKPTPNRLHPWESVESTQEVREAERVADESTESVNARLASRLIAATIDLWILAAIDGAVLYFTIKICGLSVDDFQLLPKAPLLAFFFLQNGAYLAAFTASGQTLGKMAAGIRVVADDSGSTVDFGRALLRTLCWMILAIPAGLGFLTTLASRDRRGLHDKVAGTRVTRASA